MMHALHKGLLSHSVLKCTRQLLLHCHCYGICIKFT